MPEWGMMICSWIFRPGVSSLALPRMLAGAVGLAEKSAGL